MQKVYSAMLAMADDLDSELYVNGAQHRGAMHRNAFWDGYNGMKRSPNAMPGTLAGAAFQAGKVFARQQAKNRALHPGDPKYANLVAVQIKIGYAGT